VPKNNAPDAHSETPNRQIGQPLPTGMARHRWNRLCYLPTCAARIALAFRRH
jgi:hypothetical protein